MNRIVVVAAALAMSCAAAFAGPELKITPYEAGTETGGSPATKVAAPEAAPAKAAVQFVIVATVSIEGHPVWQGLYQGKGPFADKAACEAALGDEKVKADNDGLAAMAKAKIHPDAKVGVSCESTADE
jgi:hypothetical protein